MRSSSPSTPTDRRARWPRGPIGPSIATPSGRRSWPRWRAVDATVIFDEDTPLAIVAALRPDVLVKGADWAPGTIVGADLVEARGGSVVRIDLAAGYSTTNLIDKIRGH